MVQEVQTGIGITNETTLETIEAIGTSSVKIVEGRQTRGGRFSSGADGGGSLRRTYDSSVPTGRTSPMILSENLSISELTGKQEFSISSKGLRIPMSGTYQITFSRSGGGSTHDDTIYIIKGTTENDNILYTKTLTSSTTDTVSFMVDLGKFDIITIWAEYYYSGSSSSATFNTSYSIKIQQL